MDIKHVFPPDIVSHLTDGFQEGLPFDIAHRTANLDEYHLGPGFIGQFLEPPFDLVSEVGHNLDGAAEEIAAPFFGDEGAVNLSG